MGTAGVALALAPRAILRIYTSDAAVIAGGTVLLRIAALFQLFDGLQVVATGALRGLARYAHAAGGALRGLLADRAAGGLRAVLSLRMGRSRHLGGPERGPDRDRVDAGDRVALAHRARRFTAIAVCYGAPAVPMAANRAWTRSAEPVNRPAGGWR